MSPKRLRRITRMLIAQEFVCPLCQEYCGPKEADIDHIVPVSKGGKGGDNLRAVHIVCNRIKGSNEDYSPAYYRQEKKKRTWRGKRLERKTSIPLPAYLK